MGTASETKVSVSAHWTPPKSFDEYRLLWPLGRGGMGAVYLGHDTLLDRAVAIKFISAFNPDLMSREQFLTEARAAARIQHPNVVTVYRVGEIEGRPYIIQEYLRGQSLERTTKPLPWQQVLDMAIGLTRGLSAAHRRGVLHRDLKPGNVMLPTDGGVKLLDFGLAKLTDANRSQAISLDEIAEAELKMSQDERAPTDSVDLLAATVGPHGEARPALVAAQAQKVEQEARDAQLSVSREVTPVARGKNRVSTDASGLPAQESPDSSKDKIAAQNRLAIAFGQEVREDSAHSDDVWRADPVERSSTIKGTPLYMAPEVFEGEPATRQSDLYSLAAVLYEACYGKPPHYNTSLLELHRMVTTTDAPPLSSVAPNVDPRFASVIDKCLLRDPSKRYVSADDLRDALEHLAPSTQSPSVPEGNPYRGLLPFEPQHRALFFGRQSEIGTLVDRLRTESFVLVAADSGVGKSSICRAGVLPAVKEGALSDHLQYNIATFMPGRQPLRALCEAIALALGRDEQPLIAAIKTDPSSFPRVLRNMLPPKTSLLLFIDQMEELVTVSSAYETQLVGEALSALSQKAGQLRILATVRADFVSRIATVPGIGDDINRSLFLLRPMGKDKLKEAVTGPAQLKGVMFENDEMVDALVDSTAESDSGLPLLQFALAELWDVRQGNRITAKALESIGGVMGALARHADHLMGSLPQERRGLARRQLMSLVTIDGTRARRTIDELTFGDPNAKNVLEMLVRGRLLVARETPEGSAYEVAHEALIKGWGTLKRWLDENAERRAVKHRLEQATQEWNRLHKSKDALWSAKQMVELALLEPEDYSPKEIEFVEASRSAQKRARRLRQVALLMIPVLLVCGYVGVQITARRKLDRQIADLVAQSNAALQIAERLDIETNRLRTASFEQFDHKNKEEGEKHWAQARKLAQQADKSYNRSAQILESALNLDIHRVDVSEQLALSLYRRALNAERDRQKDKRDELIERMSRYDKSGKLQALWNAPAKLSISTTPQSAMVQIQQYVDEENGRKSLTTPKELGMTPFSDESIPAGSYLITIIAADRVDVRYPILLERGERFSIDLALPKREDIPKGFVFVPKGRFLFGYGQDETLRKNFFGTAPVHRVTLEPYLIAQNETTFGEWIEYLNALPPADRKKRTPSVARGGGLGGSLELKQIGKDIWKLQIQPQTVTYSAAQGEYITFTTRQIRKTQDWLKFPIAGISYEDVMSYIDWLGKTNKLKGARLCTEHEWERAAKGADEREYPHGNILNPEDASYDETYQKVPTSMGPDEIGSHPLSNSPFGVADMVGSTWDIMISSIAPDEIAIRGGSNFFDAITARTSNRNAVEPAFRSNDLGIRICLPWPIK
jgi:serine/threonine protein kinase/formylglycine-generating enzyme required for sulfatase activity